MAFTKGVKPLAGYPQPVGEKYQVIADRTGPASYTQVTPGAPATGGDVFNASDLNMGGFEKVEMGYDTTAQFSATAIFYTGGYTNAVPKVIVKYIALVTATLGGQAQTAGSEAAAATNLSAFSWRVSALMV